MKRHALSGLLALSTAAFFVSGCAEEPIPESPDLIDLSIVAAQSADEADPYSGVAYIRIAVAESEAATALLDKFVFFEANASRALEDVPFGNNLQITIEGWSMNSETGLIGELVSRGKSSPFDVSEDSDPAQVNIVLSRVNEFALTTAVGPSGPRPTSLNAGRVGHTVTALKDGRILIIGGGTFVAGKTGDFTAPSDLDAILDSIEIFDPKTGEFAYFEGAMQNPRAFHAATLLPDGKVLVSGGITEIGGSKEALATLQIFDPVSNSFAAPTGEPITARAAHTAVVLDGNSHVMIAGGLSVDSSGVSYLANVEVYCPGGYGCGDTSKIVYNTNMKVTRAFHTANKVPVTPDNTEAVLVAGGEGEDGVRTTLETFWLNPAGFDLEQVDEMQGGPRTRHTATWIESQRYLHVIGGFSDPAHTQAVQRIDSYQATQRTFQGAEFYALAKRGGHTAVAMPGNAILIAGGYDENGALDTAEVMFEYTNQDDGKTYIDRGGVKGMASPRGGLGAALLPNRTVLIVGGVGGTGTAITMGEFFNPL